MKQEALALIGEAYRLDLGDAQWLELLARRAARIVPGAMAYSFDASAPERGVRVGMHGSCGVPESFVKATLELNRATRAQDAIRFYHHGVLCGTVSEMLEADGRAIDENVTYESSVAREGFPDTFGLTASSPARRGLVINSPLPCVTPLNPRRRLAWQQVGVHLQAAFRLREALSETTTEPEAVVDSERGVVHAEADARTPALRERLRKAALAMDAARSRTGPDEADDALALWSGLVSGRWTLIESFEHDGRRLFLAYPNTVELQEPRALTPRERTVVGYVVQGDSDKWIAYQLGITAATVARHLATALRKLGLAHRHELIWLYHSLHSRDRSRKSE